MFHPPRHGAEFEHAGYTSTFDLSSFNHIIDIEVKARTSDHDGELTSPQKNLDRTDSSQTKEKSPFEVVTEVVDVTTFPDSLQTTPLAVDPQDTGISAWLALFGAICSTFTTFGYVNAWGVFQAYYQETILREQSPSSIAWIGSIQYGLVFLPGLVVGRLFDVGYFRIISISSSILLLVSTFLVAECTVYWQFLLCQGFATGLACGGFFGPSTAMISQWFKKRRGLALGLFSAGAAIGGTVIPLVARALIPRMGFQWTIRVIGFILFTMRPRLPPSKPTESILSTRLFKSPAFTAHSIAAMIIIMGFYTCKSSRHYNNLCRKLISRFAIYAVPAYVASTATNVGLTPQSAFYLVSVTNGSSSFGRLLAGPLADRLGPMNVLIPFTALAGVMTYVWPLAKSPGSLIAITALYGICSGGYGSLLSTPILDLGEPEDVGRRIGFLMTFVAIGGLLGLPISGAVEKAYGMQAMGIYAGSIILLGVLLMSATHFSAAFRRAWMRN
ncbi:hypothetical protein D9758_009834 [Tetrapyrgos nigripes]|uniref:Major facilitator superfamily (MFS) profile domain-containing protein n=1 Tax=Tetrapyrgos nigripes TaxID=182062 RepID=A0A8H5LRU4_9AGAR|nr:hypothetical protein D9758_009834 [Tetrapyrgos nigripes]